MLGWTRLLLNRKLDETAARRALEIIERNVRAQSQVVEDLLDISRIISGKMKLNVAGEPADGARKRHRNLHHGGRDQAQQLDVQLDPRPASSPAIPIGFARSRGT